MSTPLPTATISTSANSTPVINSSVVLASLIVMILTAVPGVTSAQTRGVDPAAFQDMAYRSVGPSRGGAVTTVAGHRAQPHTFYLGVRGGGGVWKTDNYGMNWRPVSDGFIRTSSTMGAVRVAPSNPNVVYAGTGTDGIRSNVIGGRGIYRSTDAGRAGISSAWNAPARSVR